LGEEDEEEKKGGSEGIIQHIEKQVLDYLFKDLDLNYLNEET
jgi:hypothetical protein